MSLIDSAGRVANQSAPHARGKTLPVRADDWTPWIYLRRSDKRAQTLTEKLVAKWASPESENVRPGHCVSIPEPRVGDTALPFFSIFSNRLGRDASPYRIPAGQGETNQRVTDPLYGSAASPTRGSGIEPQ